MAETEADVSRLRLVLEGSRPLAFASGSSLTPSVELGVRRDGGDAERAWVLKLEARCATQTPQSDSRLRLRREG